MSSLTILAEVTEQDIEETIRRWAQQATGTKMWKRYWQCHNEIVEGLKDAGMDGVDKMEMSRQDEARYQKAEAEMFIAAYKAKAFDYALQRDYDFELAVDYVLYLMAHCDQGRQVLKKKAAAISDLKEQAKVIISRIDSMLQRSMSL